MLRCPVTKSELTEATESELNFINEGIQSGKVLNHLGQSVENKIEAGLINESKSLLLPIRNGIVILVVDQAIRLDET